MNDTINGRTPDEIKKGLGICIGYSDLSEDYCEKCPYIPDASCRDTLEIDALAYIEKLERERDAAVKILHDSKMCEACDHKGCKDCRWWDDITMRNKDLRDNWQWRGVQKEVE